MNTTIDMPQRKANDWVSVSELRSLIKSNLGYNARQVTVSKPHGNQYLHVTVRDAKVDFRKVEEFAKSFNTWTIDNTDYCEGQSINVRSTDEVNNAHAQPYIEEVKRLVSIAEMGHGYDLSNRFTLWLTEQGFYVSDCGNSRSQYVNEFDARNDVHGWAINRLALAVARL